MAQVVARWTGTPANLVLDDLAEHARQNLHSAPQNHHLGGPPRLQASLGAYRRNGRRSSSRMSRRVIRRGCSSSSSSSSSPGVVGASVGDSGSSGSEDFSSFGSSGDELSSSVSSP